MLKFDTLNVANFNANDDFGGRQYTITEGDYNLVVRDVLEIKVNDVKGHAGGFIEFEIIDGPCAGLTFRQWFCYAVDQQSKLKWMKEQFDKFALQLCVLNNVKGLGNPNNMKGFKFNAHVLAKEETFQADDGFGNLTDKQYIRNSILFHGPIASAIRACSVSATKETVEDAIQNVFGGESDLPF